VKIKGNLELDIDEQGLQARVTVTPDENGAELSPEGILALLKEKGVKEGVNSDAVDKAFRTLGKKRTEPLTFVAAQGAMPLAPTPETTVCEPFQIPEGIKGIRDRLLAKAGIPEIWEIKEEKIKKERKVLKKQALPFLPPKEEIEVFFEKKETRNKVLINPEILEVGYFAKDSLIAKVAASKPGKQGKNIMGRIIPAPQPQKSSLAVGSGVKRTGNEIRAEADGFVRRGDTWFDLLPFREHALSVHASPDKTSCLLSFTPGDAEAPAPDVEKVLAEAEKLGFQKDALLTADGIGALLAGSLTSGTPITDRNLNRPTDCEIRVDVSKDMLSATLYVRKGLGEGRKLTLRDISAAINTSGVKGYNAETLKKDIVGFYQGPQVEMPDYMLARGVPPEPGEDGKIEWLTGFLLKEEVDKLKAASSRGQAALSGLASLADFPPSKVESLASVGVGKEVLRIIPPKPGKPGKDVRGAAIPGLPGKEPEIRVFEGLKRDKGTITATVSGVLEKGTEGAVLLLRARPHRDGQITAAVSEDRMRAFLTYAPSEGTGFRPSAEEVRKTLQAAGIQKGLKAEVLSAAEAAIGRNEAITGLPVAEGKPPRSSAARSAVFHVQIATGKTYAMTRNGKADYKNQDRITRVKEGDLIATVAAPAEAAEDGWDVCGKALPADAAKDAALQAGKNVRMENAPDGSVKFIAAQSGELSTDRNILEVKEAHTVAGDVDLSTGNVKFTGNVVVKGSVLSGFSLISGGDVVVEQVVQAALLSADGSIAILQGIKGEGRAVIRAKKDLISAFAEQATLLAAGNIRIKNACVRCQIKCNGLVTLESEKGILIGGTVRSKLGLTVMHLGSATGVKTDVSFGQDYVVLDQIEQEDREIGRLKGKVLELDSLMRRLEKPGAPDKSALEGARRDKLAAMKLLEARSLRILGLRDRSEQHFPSELTVRGTLFPGVVVESHGRTYEVRKPKTKVTLWFDPAQGKILEKAVK